MSKVDHPNHYNAGKIEVIEYLKDQGIVEDFCIGNVIKYISRYKYKSSPIQDLKKAKWYLEYIINHLDKKEK